MASSKPGSSIDLYIKYESLPVTQQAQMLMALAGMYEALVDAKLGRSKRDYYPELCILSMETGHSIKFSVGFEGNEFRFDASNEGVNVTLPKWSSVVCTMGVLLAFGVNQGLSMQSAALQNEKTALEIEKLRDELARDKAAQNKLNMNYNQFHYVVNQRNITYFEVNGMSIKSRSRRGYPGRGQGESSEEDEF